MSATILIVDDEKNFRKNIKKLLTPLNYEVIEAPNLVEARKYIDLGAADIILLDVDLPDGNGPDLLDEVKPLSVPPPIIVITAYGDIQTAVNAMKNGAHDFLEKPFKLDQLEPILRSAQEKVALRRELDHYRQDRQNALKDFIVGDSPAMEQIIARAVRAAERSVNILLTGENGTGKTLLAKAISEMGERKGKPFISINCAAIQPTMLENELFGHEEGSFTSAHKRKHGLMETADNGILFLDEIGSMAPEMQAKLLTAIEDQEFRRVGGNSTIKVDIQIISASNRDLPGLLKEGVFREDLYYRLNKVHLPLPPLRERKQDIPTLAGRFIKKNNQRVGMNIQDVSPRAMQALIDYDWPGNIRQLQNTIEEAMLYCDDPVLDISHLPADLSNGRE